MRNKTEAMVEVQGIVEITDTSLLNAVSGGAYIWTRFLPGEDPVGIEVPGTEEDAYIWTR